MKMYCFLTWMFGLACGLAFLTITFMTVMEDIGDDVHDPIYAEER